MGPKPYDWRAHRVETTRRRAPLWLLAVIAASPIIVAWAVAKIADAHVNWWKVLAWFAVVAAGAVLVVAYGMRSQRLLRDQLATETAERAQLEHELATAHDQARRQRETIARRERDLETAQRNVEHLLAEPCPECAIRKAEGAA